MTWHAAHVSSQSDWQEFDAAGRRLVHEFGTLQGAELSAELDCGPWRLQTQWSQLDGGRVYDGQTSTGVPVVSQSQLRQTRSQFQAAFRVTDAWRLGVRMSGQSTWRDIASAGGASGYPERFDWALVSLGAQWSATLGPGQVVVAGWTGQQLTSSMALQLPGRDPTKLPLGPISQWELGLEWRMPLHQAWALQADARHRVTDIQRGADVAIKRNGVAVGIAHQPHTRAVDTLWAIRLGYQF